MITADQVILSNLGFHLEPLPPLERSVARKTNLQRTPPTVTRSDCPQRIVYETQQSGPEHL